MKTEIVSIDKEHVNLITTVKTPLSGDLDLRGTGITCLPENLSVGGDLDLEGTGITCLPDNLSVGGSLLSDF